VAIVNGALSVIEDVYPQHPSEFYTNYGVLSHVAGQHDAAEELRWLVDKSLHVREVQKDQVPNNLLVEYEKPTAATAEGKWYKIQLGALEKHFHQPEQTPMIVVRREEMISAADQLKATRAKAKV
jgi:hypothetical protein